VTNMAEDIAAEVIEHHGLHTPLTWIEHYPEHKGEIGEWSLVSFSSWEVREFRLYGIQRRRVDSPRWSHLETDKLARLLMPLGERGEGRVATGSLSARRMQ
jgi:hypothetical protein